MGILNAITKTAQNLKNLNLKPLILPILHREYSRYCTPAKFNTNRQNINKLLRKYKHFSNPYKTIINIPQKLELEKDLVHLTKNTYKILTGQVIFHIQQQFPQFSVIPNPPPLPIPTN